jgi:3-phosphoshikimate 1-carboxyvinyltransferase
MNAAGLPGGSVTLSDVESSQYVSSILLSAPYAHKDMRINLEGRMVSRPYISMTVQVMKAFGVEVGQEAQNAYFVKCGQSYQGRDYLVEGDASSASYFMLAAAIAKRRIRIENVVSQSLQGDMKFLDIMESLGCKVMRGDMSIDIEGRPLTAGPRVFSMGDMPDMVPTLAVLAAFRKGRTIIREAAHLRIKESDRIAALVNELKRIGITCEETADGMIIEGGAAHGAAIETYNDHRIAMSFAVAGLVTPGITIADRDCVGKSFPGFWDELKKL